MANNNDKFISRENAKTLWGYMIDLLTGKQNKLTFDDTPTQSSDNPVKSGGIFTALAGKGTYSKPQNGIPKADLESTVQASLGLADSALQSETDPTVPSWAKQTNKPSYTQDEVADGSTYKRVTQTEKNTWNGKQNALTTTQMQAVNSGITSKKVTQISTNQTNILYSLRNGAKNFVNLFDTISSRSCTATELENGGMRLACTNAVWTQYFVNINLKPATQYVLYTNMANFSGTSIGAIAIRVQYKDEHGNLVQYKPTQPGEHTSTFTTESTTDLKLSVLINDSDTARTQSIDIWVMICEKVIYDTDPSYVSTSLPNYDLTRLEAEDRAGLVEVVDSGAKNIAEIYNVTQNAITITTSASKATFSGSASQDGSITWGKIHANTTGDHVVYCNMSTSAGRFTVYNKTDSVILRSFYPVDNKTPIVLSLVAGKEYTVYSWFAAGTASACVIDLMICTKAAFGVSSAFVPYRYDPYTTVWQNLANATLYARRNGRTVTINGYVDNLSFTSGTALTLGTINDEIGKPVQQIRALCNIGSNAYSIGEVSYLTVGTDGQLKVTPKTYSGTGAVFLSFAYAF